MDKVNGSWDPDDYNPEDIELWEKEMQEFLPGWLKEPNPDLDFKLVYHLQLNHFPPVDQMFVMTAREAIYYADLGQWEKMIELPTGKELKVEEIVEQLHLYYFLGQDEEDGEPDLPGHD